MITVVSAETERKTDRKIDRKVDIFALLSPSDEPLKWSVYGEESMFLSCQPLGKQDSGRKKGVCVCVKACSSHTQTHTYIVF